MQVSTFTKAHLVRACVLGSWESMGGRICGLVHGLSVKREVVVDLECGREIRRWKETRFVKKGGGCVGVSVWGGVCVKRRDRNST